MLGREEGPWESIEIAEGHHKRAEDEKRGKQGSPQNQEGEGKRRGQKEKEAETTSRIQFMCLEKESALGKAAKVREEHLPGGDANRARSVCTRE